MWNSFKVRRAEDLLKDIKGSHVYKTKDSIIFFIENNRIDDSVIKELVKIYSLQYTKIQIFSNVAIKKMFEQHGLIRQNIQEISRDDNNTVIRLNLEVSK